MSQVILFDNKIVGSTVTVTSEAVGFERANAYDWLTYDYWKPTASGTVYYTIDLGSATSIDCWAVAAHDLGVNGASIELEYEAADAGAWTTPITAGTQISPTASEPRLQTFGSLSKRYWRFKIISASAASQIGALMIGPQLTNGKAPKVGHAPDSMARQYETTTNISQDALSLGTSIYKRPIKSRVTWDLVTRAWADTNWKPFVRHAESGKGFMYAPDSVNFTDEVSYCFIDKTAPKVSYSHPNYMSVEMPYIGIVS